MSPAALVVAVVTLITAWAGLPPWAVITCDVIAYAVWAYTHPYVKCGRCRGTGTNPGSSGRRWGACRRCKGSRQVKTLGAQMLHRAVRRFVRYYRRNRKES